MSLTLPTLNFTLPYVTHYLQDLRNLFFHTRGWQWTRRIGWESVFATAFPPDHLHDSDGQCQRIAYQRIEAQRISVTRVHASPIHLPPTLPPILTPILPPILPLPPLPHTRCPTPDTQHLPPASHRPHATVADQTWAWEGPIRAAARTKTAPSRLRPRIRR